MRVPTLKELSGLYRLNKQIKADEAYIAKLMARGEGYMFGDKYVPYKEDYKELLDKLITRREENLLKNIEMSTWMTEWIDSIDEPTVKLALTERCLLDKSWVAVAMAVGGGNTADGIRKQCKRYIDKCNDRAKKKKRKKKSGSGGGVQELQMRFG